MAAYGSKEEVDANVSGPSLAAVIRQAPQRAGHTTDAPPRLTPGIPALMSSPASRVGLDPCQPADPGKVASATAGCGREHGNYAGSSRRTPASHGACVDPVPGSSWHGYDLSGEAVETRTRNLIWVSHDEVSGYLKHSTMTTDLDPASPMSAGSNFVVEAAA